jgi:hypothetical protein
MGSHVENKSNFLSSNIEGRRVCILYEEADLERHFLPVGLIIRHRFPGSKERHCSFVNDDDHIFHFHLLTWMELWKYRAAQKPHNTRGDTLKANSHIPCRSHAALIHTCHAATLPFSDSAVSFVKVRMVDGNKRTTILLLVTTFVELRVVAGRSRKRAGRPHALFWAADANSHIPCRSHAALFSGLVRSLS